MIEGIGAKIWDAKYRLKRPNGIIVDQTVEDTWARVAGALAAPETRGADVWAKLFYWAMEDFKFLPGGRIIAGTGTGRDVTLFNCFVMGIIPDSLDGIFAHLREAALTMQQGGGIGYDFSSLRPQGSLVKGVDADASGPLTFMDTWDSMCRTIMSAGARRGAMMGTLRCDHPDIEAFVDAKRDPGRLRMFNLSTLVTDAFLAAVDADKEWPLVFGGEVRKIVQARDLWDRIMRATYDVAEPGVIFIDRINRRNNLAYCETIISTNPCGEIPLPPYGACLLGSINLAALVRAAFTRDAGIVISDLRDLVRPAVRMLDNVIDVSKFTLEAQRQEAQNKRRMGLGITGLADALIMTGQRYGSRDAIQTAEDWMAAVEREAYLASAELAAEKGSFPAFDRDKFLASEHVQGLDDEVKTAIAEKGMRNSHLTAIAPTGTISLFAGNVSGGIEPPFSFRYTRDVLQPDGSKVTEEVTDFAYRKWRELRGDEPLPNYFLDAQTLRPKDHIAMLAAVAKHVDQSISKTVNLPETIPFADFKGVYRRAHELGCKSCTTYRPNEVTGSVLNVIPAEEKAPAPGTNVVTLTAPLVAPDELDGKRYKIRWPGSDHALYVLITDVVEHGRPRPYEIFLISNDAESDAWRVALGRMISAVWRRGGDVAFVATELQAIFGKAGGGHVNGKFYPSLPAAIGHTIEHHMRAIGFLPEKQEDQHEIAAAPAAVVGGGAGGSSVGPLSGNAAPPVPAWLRQCPACGQPALIREENCDRCTSCTYSKCQ
ncbi:MAG TPA: adenosylcobalamin-dependent ribonucleoside-diphosphate reductase [Stellaceae bacterium]|jgi:ribonucleoside-diphosphate reductase alpha chain|nr:adenosylcobalamin-dependent ribonucleoside-diphosphate reductase [Stellaceae bacterium]